MNTSKFHLIILFNLLFFVPFAKATKVILIGGGDPGSVTKRLFLKEADPNRLILVCRWASSESPSRVKGEIEDELIEAGATNVQNFPTFSQIVDVPEMQDKLIAQIEKAGGLYFDGGAQDHLVDQLKQVPRVWAAIRKARIIAGNSAGAAFVSDKMLFQNENDPELHIAPGGGILPKRLVETHLLTRHRPPRFEAAVKRMDSDTIGIGVEEGSAVMVENNLLVRVIGNGEAQIVVHNGDGTVRSISLEAGDIYDLHDRHRESGHFPQASELVTEDHD